MVSRYPKFAAKEGADRLERRLQSTPPTSGRDPWRSWGRSAEYNIKLMWNTARPVPFRRDLEGWRACRRTNTEKMEHIALGDWDVWKTRRTVSARRLEALTIPQVTLGRLWKAVAHDEVNKMKKRPNRQRAGSRLSSSWSYAAKRSIERLNYEIEPAHERDRWTLALKWNSRMRLMAENGWWRRLKELARRMVAG